MRRSLLRREFESGDSAPLRALRLLVLAGGLCFLLMAGILGLTWPQQMLLGLFTVLIAAYLNRRSSSYLVTLTLILMSMFATFRYGYWRVVMMKHFFEGRPAAWSAIDAVFVVLLLGAEAYSFLVLLLGYLQTLWPLRRAPVPLPDDPEDWPAVDLLIATYNEPLSLVRYTVLAAMNIDWPADKLNIYLLDDGRRTDFQIFAEDAGIGYTTRADNRHAKAGNINAALERLHAPFVAIFDADHVPTRSFLQVTLGWFLRDRKLALLQTPHHFYSSDPFERNLDQPRAIPNEGELFSRVVQDGSDFWNATFFSGSCAVLRRAALDEVGGIAVETVTEDAHTSLRMQMKGWNTAYINIPQAAGLATERLSEHVQQRVRWARGMVQILRLDNPLFARGLTGMQRLCYFNSMTYFLCALPRLIFLHAPLIYLLFGRVSIPGYWAAILAYSLPHLALSALTNSRIQGQHRRAFWNEIYETVLAPYILIPTLWTLLMPKRRPFNVTAKGNVIPQGFFDTRIAQPFLIMLAFNLLGVFVAMTRLVQVRLWPFAAAYDGTHPGIVAVNVAWACFNIVILSVAASVACESQQRRRAVRVTMSVLADVILPDGTVALGVTADVSSGGALVNLNEASPASAGACVSFVVQVLDGIATLPATIVSTEGQRLRVRFDSLTMHQEESLAMILYSRADSWLERREGSVRERPLRSLQYILKLSWRGMSQVLPQALGRRDGDAGRFVTHVAALLPLVLFGGGVCQPASAAMVQTMVAAGPAPGLALAMPVSVHAEASGVGTSTSLSPSFDRTWWKVPGSPELPPQEAGTAIAAPELQSEARGWPSRSGHSRLMMALHRFTISSRVVDIFLRTSPSPNTMISAEIVRREQLASSRPSAARHANAPLSPWSRTNLMFSEFPWLVVISLTMLCVLMATLLRTMLGRRARVRLQGF